MSSVGSFPPGRHMLVMFVLAVGVVYLSNRYTPVRRLIG